MKLMMSLAGLGALASCALIAPPAHAAGCGGYVNVWVSGCAPWDNNPRRMPGTPGYTAPRISTPPVALQQPRIVAPPMGNRLITDNGAGLRNNTGFISTNGGNLIGKIR